MTRNYGHQLLIALDQLGNALIAGWADETISARAWRSRTKPRWGAARIAIDAMFFWQDEHCKQAHASELARLHSAPGDRPQ